MITELTETLLEVGGTGAYVALGAAYSHATLERSYAESRIPIHCSPTGSFAYRIIVRGLCWPVCLFVAGLRKVGRRFTRRIARVQASITEARATAATWRAEAELVTPGGPTALAYLSYAAEADALADQLEIDLGIRRPKPIELKDPDAADAQDLCPDCHHPWRRDHRPEGCTVPGCLCRQTCRGYQPKGVDPEQTPIAIGPAACHDGPEEWSRSHGWTGARIAASMHCPKCHTEYSVGCALCKRWRHRHIPDAAELAHGAPVTGAVTVPRKVDPVTRTCTTCRTNYVRGAADKGGCPQCGLKIEVDPVRVIVEHPSVLAALEPEQLQRILDNAARAMDQHNKRKR